jgi:Flp pilus assembly protein TadG
VEAVLALPVLLFLVLGLLQIGWVFWLRVQLQHAAQMAARAYTVWQPTDEDQAEQHARKAAWMAMRPPPPGLSMDLSIRSGEADDNKAYNYSNPGVHQITLKANVTVPGILGRHWNLEARAQVLREETFEDVAESN